MKKRLIAIVLLLGLAMQLFGCTEKIVYEYIQEHSKVNDPCASGWLVNGNLAVVSLDNNTYRFDNNISEEVRSQFIHKQQELCGLLRENGIAVETCEFFVLMEIAARALQEECTWTCRNWELTSRFALLCKLSWENTRIMDTSMHSLMK